MVLLASALMLGASCAKGPNLRTVVGFHGQEWGDDGAPELDAIFAVHHFLCGYGGITPDCLPGHGVTKNSAPGDWRREHLHSGSTDATSAYYDERSEGKDARVRYGVDAAPLAFFVGHGDALHWNAASKPQRYVDLSDWMLFGNNRLRYLWQCSCEVLAHGVPRDGRFVQPWTFEGCRDSQDCRNVYERWLIAVDPKLRMVCGGSSRVCNFLEQVTEGTWDNYLNHGYDVADSFLFGIINADAGVPLCLTRAGEDALKSAFYDQRFTKEANSPAGAGETEYAYSMYPKCLLDSCQMVPPPVKGLLPFEPPAGLPILRARATLPKNLAESTPLGTEGEDAFRVCERKGVLSICGDTRSGAVYLEGPRPREAQLPPSEDLWGSIEAQIERFLDEWDPKVLGIEPEALEEKVEPTSVYALVLERVPVANTSAKPERAWKSAQLIWRRTVSTHGLDIPILGLGGRWTVQMAPDRSLITASQVKRTLSEENAEAGVRTVSRGEALNDALKFLEARGIADAYAPQPVDVVWGYKEEAGNCVQEELRIVYQFTFEPKDGDRYKAYPPRTVEILGQRREAEKPTDTNLCKRN